MIANEDIERVREAADIVQIIGEHVKLRRVGNSWRGPCPFHQGTKPNLSVVPKTGGYKCFVCGETGNVFTFLQKRLGMDFPTAVRHVAEKVGITIQETSSRREGPDPREPLWEVNGAAAEFFTRSLWEDAAAGKARGRESRGAGAAAAREYLASRAIDRATADRFGLGYAPPDAEALRQHLAALGYDDSRQLEVGVLVRREDSGELRPRFRDRLIFPIYDIGGHIVGFGGRILGPGDVKYLNSSESAVFSKGRLLYGLNWAKGAIRREERAILVEGYFDLLRLVVAGIEEVVAPLGTALTEDQAQLIGRYAKSVYLLYDSDEAGQRATFRAADVLLAHGLAVQVVTLPDGEDPDTFVRKGGGDALRKRIGAAVDVFERKVELLKEAGWFEDLRRKRRAIDRLLPTIRATRDAVTRELYVTRLAEAAGISTEAVAREIEAGRPKRRGLDQPSGRSSGALVPQTVPPGDLPPTGDRRAPEDRRAAGDAKGWGRSLVLALLVGRHLVAEVRESITPQMLRHPALRAIYSALIAHPDATTDELAALIDEEFRPVLEELHAGTDAIVDPDRTARDVVSGYHVRTLQREMADLERMIPLSSGQEQDALIRQKFEKQKEIQMVQGRGARWRATRTA